MSGIWGVPVVWSDLPLLALGQGQACWREHLGGWGAQAACWHPFWQIHSTVIPGCLHFSLGMRLTIYLQSCQFLTPVFTISHGGGLKSDPRKRSHDCSFAVVKKSYMGTRFPCGLVRLFLTSFVGEWNLRPSFFLLPVSWMGKEEVSCAPLCLSCRALVRCRQALS